MARAATKRNPAVSPEQYRLAQSVLHGTVKTPTAMTKKVARELIEKTPAHLRSKWSKHNKRNPESDSAAMYESFHGTPSTAVDEYEEKEHYHSNLAALGELVGLKVRTVSGYDVTIGFESAQSNPRSTRRPTHLLKKATPEQIQAATDYLRKRYREHTEKYPRTRETTSEAQYIKVNLPYTLRNMMEGYGHWAESNPGGRPSSMQPKSVAVRRLAIAVKSKYGNSADISHIIRASHEPDVMAKAGRDTEWWDNLAEAAIADGLTIDEFDEIVEKRADNPKRKSNLWPFDSFSRTTIYHVPSGHKFHTSTSHKGHTIYKSETKSGYVVPSLDKSSVFDSPKDAKRFIDYWAKHSNPKHRKGPFTQSGELVGKASGVVTRPIDQFLGTVGKVGGYLDESLERGLDKIGGKKKGNGKRRRNPEHALLCSTEDGKNLQIIGGDQSIDLPSLKIDGPLAEKELVTIGEVWGLNYRTEKVFGDGGKEDGNTEYIHILGPKETKPHRGGDLWADAVPPKDDVFGTGELPTLIYDKRNCKQILSGGMYHIERPLMGTSAGIEN